MFYSCIDMWLLDDVILVELLDSDFWDINVCETWNTWISLRWHTTYDAFPGAGPIPVALQPPNAVPHLVEFHHQRGDLGVKRTKVLWNVRQQHHNFEKSKLWCVRRPTDEDIRMIYHMKVFIFGRKMSSRYWCRCKLIDAFLLKS